MKSLMLLMALTLNLAYADGEWMTDFSAAKTRARQEKKLLLLDFTGSDWCGWCMKLKKEVFSTPEFVDYAKKYLILVEVDFPMEKAQSEAQKKANAALAKKFKVEGYPTIIILKSSGRKAGELEYEPGGPKPFLARLEELRAK